MVEKLPRSAASSRWAASRSWIDAAVTTTPSSSPVTSTATWRLTPFVRFPPSHPRRDRGTVSEGWQVDPDPFAVHKPLHQSPGGCGCRHDVLDAVPLDQLTQVRPQHGSPSEIAVAAVSKSRDRSSSTIR